MNMAFECHPSLKKALKECEQWLTYPSSQTKPLTYAADLQEWLEEPKRPARMKGAPMDILGHYYGIAACDAYRRKDVDDVARFLRWSVALRTLDVRRRGMFSEHYPNESGWPQRFWDSMKAAGPLMLSQWALGDRKSTRLNSSHWE